MFMDNEIYFLQNKHWKAEEYNYLIKRKCFDNLKENLLKHKLILSLEGPRRVGKSILLLQLIDYLIKKEKIKPIDILYFSFDLYSKSVLQILKEYEQIRAKSLYKGKIYLFLDELQKRKNWQTELKLIYDNYPNIKLIISGSTLRASKKESLAGRIIEFFISYLSFEEYLIFTENTKLLKSEIDDSFLSEYSIYLYRQYPELAINKNLNTKEYITSIIKKIIFEDSKIYLNNVDIDKLQSILNIVLRDPGQIINYTDLAKDLGIDRRTVSDYISFLVDSAIIRKIYNFSNNARKVEFKSKKLYPYSTTLIKYIMDNPDVSKIVETDVAFQLNAMYFWNLRGEEIDFVIFNNKDNKDKNIAVEVKYRKRIDSCDVKTFNSKNFKKLNIKDKYLIIRDGSALNYNDTSIIPIKYYVLWKKHI